MLLALLLLLPSLPWPGGKGESRGHPSLERVFVGVEGDVRAPGVFGFPAPPTLQELVRRAGGLTVRAALPLAQGIRAYPSGSRVLIQMRAGKSRVTSEPMSAHRRVTLGLRLDLNKETAEGLTALPGVGPRIAGRIVQLRRKRGGFRHPEELLEVRGVGPRLLEKMKPFLVL